MWVEARLGPRRPPRLAGEIRAASRAKYGGASTARRAVRLPVASVGMTFVLLATAKKQAAAGSRDKFRKEALDSGHARCNQDYPVDPVAGGGGRADAPWTGLCRSLSYARRSGGGSV